MQSIFEFQSASNQSGAGDEPLLELTTSNPRSRNMKVLVRGTTLLALTTFSTTAYAGAWPAEEGGSYQKLAINIFESDERFGDELPGCENFEDFT
ncbi:MAG: hypothetical protein AAF692_12525, partial [Pseudomonadota bacterium]